MKIRHAPAHRSLLALLVASLLAGCGGGSDEAAGTPPPVGNSPAQPVPTPGPTAVADPVRLPMRDVPTPTAQATLAPGVVVLSPALTAAITTRSETSLTFSAEPNLFHGTIFLVDGEPRRVTVITRNAGGSVLVQTDTPSLEAVFSTLRIHQRFGLEGGSFQAADAGREQALATGGERRQRSAVTLNPVTRTLEFDFSNESGPRGLSGQGKATLDAYVDIDYSVLTGFRSAELEVTSAFNASADLTLKEQETYQPIDKHLGTVTWPISLTVLDAAASRVLGVAVTKLVVPLRVGATVTTQFTAGFRLKTEAAFRFNASATEDAAVANLDNVNNVSFEFLEAAAPNGANTLATYKMDGYLYVQARPSLVLLERLAAVGGDLKGGVAGTATLQVTTATTAPNYCVSYQRKLRARETAYFEGIGVGTTELWSGEQNLPIGKMQFSKGCKRPVEVLVTQPAEAEFWNNSLVSVEVRELVVPDGPAPADRRPGGSVEIELDGQSCTTSLSSEGKGSCTLRASQVGKRTAVAAYKGDALFNEGEGGGVIAVRPADTVATVLPAKNSMVAGTKTTYRVVVAPQTLAGAPVPKGSALVHTADRKPICSATLDASGAGECTGRLIDPGSVSVVAAYSGEPNYKRHKSAIRPITVLPRTYSLRSIGTGSCGDSEYDVTIGGQLKATLAETVFILELGGAIYEVNAPGSTGRTLTYPEAGGTTQESVNVSIGMNGAISGSGSYSGTYPNGAGGSFQCGGQYTLSGSTQIFE